MTYRTLINYALVAGLTYTEARRVSPGEVCDLYVLRRRYDDEQHGLKREVR